MTEEERQRISVPLDEWAKQLVRETANEVIDKHVATCSLREDVVEIKANEKALHDCIHGNGQRGLKSKVNIMWTLLFGAGGTGGLVAVVWGLVWAVSKVTK
jgi:hypothetical protein